MSLITTLSLLKELFDTHSTARTLVTDESVESLSKIGDIHIQSYKQAVADAKRGNYQNNMHTAIGHLRDAFNFHKASIEPKGFRRWFLTKEKISTEMNTCVQIAVWIVAAHRSLSDEHSARYWRSVALEAFEKYGEAEIEITHNNEDFSYGPQGIVIDHRTDGKERRTREIEEERRLLIKILDQFETVQH
jgi:hypothetical protein